MIWNEFFDELRLRIGTIDATDVTFRLKIFSINNFLEDLARGWAALVELERQILDELYQRQGASTLDLLNQLRQTAIASRSPNPPEATPEAARNLCRALGVMQLSQIGGRDQNYKHLLTHVLSRLERTHGFDVPLPWTPPGAPPDPRQRTVTLLGFVPPQAFRNQLLVRRRQWKDPTVPAGHGEFSHRIQWFMIMTTLAAPDIGWAELYRQIGAHRHTRAVFGDNARWADLGLWDALVDRNRNDRNNVNGPYNTTVYYDFRSPESLHRYLISSAATPSLPLLSAFIRSRDQKRENGVLADRIEHAKYIAKKLYGTEIRLMSRGELDSIINLLNGGNQAYLVASPVALPARPPFPPVGSVANPEDYIRANLT